MAAFWRKRKTSGDPIADGTGPLGSGLTDGQLIAAIAMAREMAVVERPATAANDIPVHIIAAASALLGSERVYVAYPDEQQAVDSLPFAEALLGRFGMKVGLISDTMHPQAMSPDTSVRGASRSEALVGLRVSPTPEVPVKDLLEQRLARRGS